MQEESFFYRIYHALGLGTANRAKIFVARMLMRELCAVANLLVCCSYLVLSSRLANVSTKDLLLRRHCCVLPSVECCDIERNLSDN